MEIKNVSINSEHAVKMMAELSARLVEITGADGTLHFDPMDMQTPRAVFSVAYIAGEPVGCGGIREYSQFQAEVKRLYSKYRGLEIGRGMLEHLENEARRLGYREMLVQTKYMNTNALAFYPHCGYELCERFGVYQSMPEAVCYHKLIEGNT